jgi:hypothetical protein
MGIVLGCIVAFVFGVITFRFGMKWWRRHKRRRHALPHPGGHSTPIFTGSEKIPALRQNLLRKVVWDEAVFERLIEFERTRLPNAPLHTLLEAAIERWERDNR